MNSLFGVFKSSCTALVGVLWKVPFRLSRTKKAGIRKRLRMVEDNLNELNQSGIHIKALDTLNLVPRYSHLKAKDRYTFFSRKHQTHRPVHLRQHYTKVDVSPTSYPGYERE